MSSNSSPNILISTESDLEFQTLRSFLKSLLGVNSYTIYKVNSQELSKQLWMKNCQLLIDVNTNQLDSDKLKCFDHFLKQNGKILSLPSSTVKEQEVKSFNDLSLLLSKNDFPFESVYQNDMNVSKHYLFDESFRQIFFYYQVYSGTHYVTKIIPIIDQEKLVYSSRFVFERFFKEKLKLSTFRTGPKNGKQETFKVFTQNKLTQSVSVVESYLESQIRSNCKFESNHDGEFDEHLYFQNLKTKNFGTILLYTELTSSTMATFDSLPKSIDNLVVVAKEQIQGQGNNKNEWLSPIGCCMFTLYKNLDSNKFLPSRLCLLQFTAALACVKAIRSESNHENLEFQIKWPNDIYYNKTTKIGGILARSSFMGDQMFVKIGVGFNLDNEHPTECLNKVLRENNLPEWKSEIFIAKFLNHFDTYFHMVDTNVNKFIDEFQQNWLHQNQKVKIEHLNEEVEIVGINEYGYLRCLKQDNTEEILQPDGNRFDYMQNLIVLRNTY